jgi:hypothetical protein
VDRRILRLGRALREEGAPVSTPEILDAARAALAVGVDRRDDLRAALRAALVKRSEFIEAFDGHFERLFPSVIPKPRKRSRGTGEAPEDRGLGTGEQAARERRESRERTGERPRASSAAPTPGYTGEGHADEPGSPERREPEQNFDDHDACETAGGGPFPKAAEHDEHRRRQGLERRRLLAKGFRERWESAEEREVADAMEELVRRLANRLSRRRRRAKRGAVDLAGTLRANLVHGGVPFVLRKKARVQGRRDLVLLADVSGSVRRAASLFLLILGRLRDRFAGVRAFAYVDRPAEIPASLGGRLPAEIAAALATTLPLDALSDHGETFRRFNRDFSEAGGGRSVVVILGDARNNRFPAQEWELEALRRRCHRLVWVVPEPESLWGSGDSAIAAYAPFCDAVIAAPTPAALAAASARLLAVTY